MSLLQNRLPSPIRVLRATPLRLLTGVAIAMAAVAVYATSLKLERLLFGLGLVELDLVKANAFWIGHRMQRDSEGLV